MRLRSLVFLAAVLAALATVTLGLGDSARLATAQEAGVANVAPEPQPGGLTQVVAGTTDIQALIDAQTFDVSSIWSFDIATQQWKSYVVGAPTFVNTLSSLNPAGIVTIKAAPAPSLVAGSPTATLTPQVPSETLRPAMEFTLATLDGGDFSLADYAGRPIMLYFWASWCGFCRGEALELQLLWEEYQAKDILFVGVNILDSDERARAYVEQYQWTFPVVLDRDGAVPQAYRVPGTPTVVFIQRDLKIVAVQVGAIGEDTLRRRIDDLLIN